MVQDVKEGKGISISKIGEVFVGDFKEGLKHGIGEFKDIQGHFYKGDYLKDKK